MTSSASPKDQLEKLEEVLRRLCEAGLKVNVAKLTFCALKMEYLGYVLTKDGIKPQSNKVQAILVTKSHRSQTTQTLLRYGAILP